MKKGEEARSATLRRIQRRRTLANIRKTIIASSLFAAALLTYCYVGRQPLPVSELARDAAPKPTDVAAPTPARRSRAAPPAEPPPPALPIDQSDPFVRQLARALSTHPQLAVWLVNENLIRRFAASVANISEGMSPRKQVEFLAPESPFAVVLRDDRIFIAPRSAERYDDLAEAFASLNVDTVTTVYRRLRPLIFHAYAELGYTDHDFDGALGAAIAELWATPVRNGEIELAQVGMSYQYADPELESMSGAQKQLFRMGPRNQQLMRGQLLAISRALELLELSEPPAEPSEPSQD